MRTLDIVSFGVLAYPAMRTIPSGCCMSEVQTHEIQFKAVDGFSLTGTWFLPGVAEPPPSIVVVVVGGAAIPAAFYYRMARYFAAHGAGVLTFDYRGIGLSRGTTLRGLEAGIEHWGVLDLGAALSAATETFPRLPVTCVAHSIGALLLGAAPGAESISKAVLLAPHTGYSGDYAAKWRLPMYVLWHVLMPSLTKIVGYFPGRALRLGEDLPRQFALDWGRHRRPELARTREQKRRFSEILAKYGAFRAKTLAISISDDAFAPPRAGQRLLAIYPSVESVHEVIAPTNLGRRRLGHLGFFGGSRAEVIWQRCLAWLLLEETAGRASHDRASSAGVPPSGTKGNVLAGSTTP
jgi:predicted alpha/beta hydrolase